jgi:(E)-4-hydroxy-3-methyl-but-2-enyl pyrophosphate reductase
MKVMFPDNTQGFCFGVKRAIDMVLRHSPGKRIDMLGSLVHNPEVVEDLNKNNIFITDNIDSIESDIVAITAHGAPKGIQKQLTGKTIIDTTCPYVISFQKKVEQMDAEGYQIVILGSKQHPEIKSVMSFTRAPIVVESPDCVLGIGRFDRIALLSQTTQTIDNLRRTASNLVTHTDYFTIINTICPSTRKRQSDAVSISKRVKVAIVIGGYISANTSRLVSILKNNGVKTFWIERSDSLSGDLLSQIWQALTHTKTDRVGLISGASTPLDSVMQAKVILEEYTA